MPSRRKNDLPTQDRLQELFDYDPEEGIFQRKQWVRSRKKGPFKFGAIGAGRITELGYVVVMVDGVNHIAGVLAHIYVHGMPPAGKIKYLNGNRLDNRISNIGVHSGETDEIRTTPLTLERLKELVDYDPETGFFRDRVTGERVGGGHGQGYRAIGLDYKRYLEHRIAWFYMTGEWPPEDVDHVNRDKADNRWKNLRLATRTENNLNKNARQGNESGVAGIARHGAKWRVRLQIKGKVYDGGTHETIEDAKAIREMMLKRYGGSS